MSQQIFTLHANVSSAANNLKNPALTLLYFGEGPSTSLLFLSPVLKLD